MISLLLAGSALTAHFLHLHSAIVYSTGIGSVLVFTAFLISSIRQYLKQSESKKLALIRELPQKERCIEENKEYVEYAKGGKIKRIDDLLKSKEKCVLPETEAGLFMALCEQGNVMAVASMLRRNFDYSRVPSIHPCGFSLLHMAVSYAEHSLKALSFVESILICAPELVNQPALNGEKSYPLQLAISMTRSILKEDGFHDRKDRFNIVQLLITTGADVDAKNAKGLTPLISAVEGSQFSPYLPILEILIAEGADISTTNEEGKTAFQIIQESHSEWFKQNQTRLNELFSP